MGVFVFLYGNQLSVVRWMSLLGILHCHVTRGNLEIAGVFQMVEHNMMNWGLVSGKLNTGNVTDVELNHPV